MDDGGWRMTIKIKKRKVDLNEPKIGVKSSDFGYKVHNEFAEWAIKSCECEHRKKRSETNKATDLENEMKWKS